jgi:hypothetical protein
VLGLTVKVWTNGDGPPRCKAKVCREEIFAVPGILENDWSRRYSCAAKEGT